MDESAFLRLAEQCLGRVEAELEALAQERDWDLECQRSGNVLEIEFLDQGSKMIVNSQAAMQEIWVAARAGGFHYRFDGQLWRNTRDEGELFAQLVTFAQVQTKA